MKKVFFVLTISLLLLISCDFSFYSADDVKEDVEELIPSDVKISSSDITEKELIITSDSVIEISDMDQGFVILSTPEFVQKRIPSKTLRKDIKAKEGAILKTNNKTFIPYPDLESYSSVFYGKDLGIKDDEVVKVHARKLKQIENVTDCVTADWNPVEGVNYCTKKTDSCELYEGIIALDLRSFTGKEKKHIILNPVQGGAGTLEYTSHGSDFGIVDPETWENRDADGYKVLDLTGSGNTLYVYVSTMYQDFDTKSGKTIAKWKDEIKKRGIELPSISAQLLPLNTLSKGISENTTEVKAYYISHQELDSNKTYALECSRTDSRNGVQERDMFSLRRTMEPRVTDGSTYPYFLPCPAKADDTVRYIYFGQIKEDFFFTNSSFIGNNCYIKLVECPESHEPKIFSSADLGKLIKINQQVVSFVVDNRNEELTGPGNVIVEFFKDSQGTMPLVGDGASMAITEKNKKNPYSLGNMGCDSNNDEINRTLSFGKYKYPISILFENYTDGDYYVKITPQE